MTSRRASVLACVPAVVAAVSARADYEAEERLSLRTQALMWPAYLAGAVLIVRNLAASERRRPSSWAGAAIAASGAGALVAGSSRFASFAQLAGREQGALVTGGIYRHTRHPQYVGNVLLCAGSALARRSKSGAALSATAAAAYAYFVPAEERHLERVFGDSYVAYRKATPRWLGAG